MRYRNYLYVANKKDINKIRKSLRKVGGNE